MRYLVISDVHGDLQALEAVLADAPSHDAVLFLGDALDFGPEPEECIQRLRTVSQAWVQGNHDAAVGSGEPGDGWSPSRLSPGSRALLADLPESVEVDGATIRHLFRPGITPPFAVDFDSFSTPLCMVGHTHVPFLYRRGPGGDGVLLEPPVDEPIEIGADRAIVNPGAVSLSFLDPDVSSYLMYEQRNGSATLTWRAVPRSSAGAVERMRANGAPPDLIASQRSYVAGELPIMQETAAGHRAWAAGLDYSSSR
jgi:hypothetical protein